MDVETDRAAAPGAAERARRDGDVRIEVAVAAATLRVDAWTAEVVTALREHGVRAVVLKGPSVARALYPHGGARAYIDADLLVDATRLDVADGTLRRLEFEPDTTPVIDARLEHHADSWWRPRDGAIVDLHTTLPWVGVSRAEAWQILSGETESLAVAGVGVDVLSPPALAVQLALHAVYHGRTVEGPLHDLRLAFERWDDGVWREARELAARLGALGPFGAGLLMAPGGALLVRDLGLDLPDAVGAEVRLAAFGPPGATELERLLAHAGWGARARIVARQVVPPRAFMKQWWPRARAGVFWLALAYLRRWWVVSRRVVPALAAFVSARRTRGQGR